MIATSLMPVWQPSPVVRDYLSWSAITAYQQCPLRYYFRYVRGLPEKTISSSLVFGSAIHQAIELHFRELLEGNEPPGLEALLGAYDRHWQSVDLGAIRFGKEDARDSLGILAAKMLGAFQKSELSQPRGDILGIEETLRGEVIPGCPEVLGRIDLLIEEDHQLVLTDVKTSRSRWTSDQAEQAAGQLHLYYELLQQHLPGTRIRLRFAVLTKTKEPSLDLHEIEADLRQIARTKRLIERIWRAIQARHFYPAPSAMNCAGCSFREPCQNWPE